jgi:hypothetical protein
MLQTTAGSPRITRGILRSSVNRIYGCSRVGLFRVSCADLLRGGCAAGAGEVCVVAHQDCTVIEATSGSGSNVS